MAKGKLATAFNFGYTFLDKLWLILYFTVLRWLVYISTFIGSIFLLETIAYSQSYFAGNMVSVFEGALSIMISFVYITNFTKMTWFWFAGGRAIFGHLIAGISDIFFVQFFIVFRIFDTIMYYILEDGTVRVNDLGIALGPASCNSSGYPNYKVSDIKVIGQFIETVRELLEFSYCVSLGTILDSMHLGWIKKLPGVGNTLSTDYCTPPIKDFPIVGSLVHNAVVNLESQSLIPTVAFDMLFGVFDVLFNTIIGDLSAGDILRHQLYLNRLPTDSSGKITGGSKPFEGYIDRAKLKIMGCP